MKLRNKVANLLRKIIDWLDPELAFDYPTPIPPICQDTYNIDNVNIKLTYALRLVAGHPDFNAIVRENMAHKIAESLMSSRALSIDQKTVGGNVEYVGNLKVLSPL